MLRYILRGTNQPFEYELHTGLNTVGRNPENQFRIPEASVSSFHAEITVLESDGSVTVRDLQSTNGTFIEGQPVEQARLADGQQLQLGNVEMRLVVEEYDVKIPTGAGVHTVQAAGTLQSLPDGTLACSRNPAIAATHQAIGGCQAVIKCPGVFHSSSLRTMKLAGGKAGLLLFCGDCNAKCEPIPGATDRPAPKKGIFSRLTQTILIGRKKG